MRKKTIALIITAIYVVFCTVILLLSTLFGFLPPSFALLIWVFVIVFFLYPFRGTFKKIEEIN